MVKTKCNFLIGLIGCILVSCSTCEEKSNKKDPEIYIGIQSSSEEERKLAKNFLNEISREINTKDYVHIDLIKDSGIEIKYSSPGLSRRDFNKIIDQIDIQQSNSKVLPEVFHRILKLAKQNKGEREVFAYILSPGTSDDLVLNKIRNTIDEFSSNTDTNIDNVKVYLIGVVEHRFIMSEAMSGISSITANNETEWEQYTDDFDAPKCSQ